MSKRINWSGVFPAVTTQFNDDFSINLEKTHQVISNVIRDGVSGLVVCGSVGENTSLSAEEKIAVTEVAVDASRGRVPVICGVAEFTSLQAAKVANAVRKVGVDGVMLMPALVYGSKPFETAEHFRYVARHGLQQPAHLQERRDPGHPDFPGRLRQRGVLQGFLRRHPAFHRRAQ